MRSICSMRSLLAASCPTFLRSSSCHPRALVFSLPFRPILSRSRPGQARSFSLAATATATAEVRTGVGGPVMEARAAQSGEIHVIVGPMFAGKTTALLRRVQTEAGTGRYEPPSTPLFVVYWIILQTRWSHLPVTPLLSPLVVWFSSKMKNLW